MDRWAFEKRARLSGYQRIAGVDEAGRGPLAGPVVAAAVILPDDFDGSFADDSKKLSEKKRDALFSVIYENSVAIGIGIIDPPEIDRTNILQASLTAMAHAAANLSPGADYLLIDGNRLMGGTVAQEAVVKGDARSVSVGAASIVAKVTRDRLMAEYDREYPGFGFARHKGYGTRQHLEALSHLGICPIHRKTFRKVRELVDGFPVYRQATFT